MKALLLLHLASAMLLLGASGHAAIAALLIQRGRLEKARFLRTYARLTLLFHVLTLLLGAALYPSFGLQVRQAWMDQALPWATGLFEIKEHLVALALPLSLLQWRLTQPPAMAPDALRTLVAIAIFATILFGAVVGALLVSYRSL